MSKNETPARAKARIIRTIEQAKKKISDGRDMLRSVIDEAEDIFEDADTALEELDVAADALSRHL